MIRAYRHSDRQAVRHICVETAWCGEPAEERVGDGWIWAEFWTRFYTDRLPYYSWVVEDLASKSVVGYLQGTHDVRLVDQYTPFVLPAMLRRWVHVRGLPVGRPLVRMGRSLLRGELELPARVARRYPATFHFNLMPEARGQGWGSKLFACFVDRMRLIGIRGIHVQALSTNEAVRYFLARRGFQQVCDHPLSAFGEEDLSTRTFVCAICSRESPDRL